MLLIQPLVHLRRLLRGVRQFYELPAKIVSIFQGLVGCVRHPVVSRVLLKVL